MSLRIKFKVSYRTFPLNINALVLHCLSDLLFQHFRPESLSFSQSNSLAHSTPPSISQCMDFLSPQPEMLYLQTRNPVNGNSAIRWEVFQPASSRSPGVLRGCPTEMQSGRPLQEVTWGRSGDGMGGRTLNRPHCSPDGLPLQEATSMC